MRARPLSDSCWGRSFHPSNKQSSLTTSDRCGPSHETHVLRFLGGCDAKRTQRPLGPGCMRDRPVRPSPPPTDERPEFAPRSRRPRGSCRGRHVMGELARAGVADDRRRECQWDGQERRGARVRAGRVGQLTGVRGRSVVGARPNSRTVCLSQPLTVSARFLSPSFPSLHSAARSHSTYTIALLDNKSVGSMRAS